MGLHVGCPCDKKFTKRPVKAYSFDNIIIQGFCLASALGLSPKIVPDVQELAVQFGQFVRDDLGSAHGTVMHSVAIVFLSNNTIADWQNFCKRQTGFHNFTPKILIH